jgi:HEAT repeat protein
MSDKPKCIFWVWAVFFRHHPVNMLLLGLTLLLGGVAYAQTPDPAELAKGLKSKDPKVRRQTAKDLGALGEKARVAVMALAETLKDPDPDVSISAAYAIGHIGPPAKAAIPSLVRAFEDKRKATWGSFPGGSPTVRDAAWFALHGVGADSTPAILPFLKSKDDGDRSLALWVLGTAGSSAEPHLATIIGLTKDKAKEVRYEAVRALGTLVLKPEASLPALEAVLLEKDDGFFQQLAVLAIAKFGPKAAQSVPALFKQLDSLEREKGTTRAFAAYALGEIGGAAEPALPRLSELVKDEGWVFNFNQVPDRDMTGNVGPWAEKAIEKIKGDLAKQPKEPK